MANSTNKYKNVTVFTENIQLDDSNTEIFKDGSNNISFKDAVSGTKTLAELGGVGVAGADGEFQINNSGSLGTISDKTAGYKFNYDGTAFTIGDYGVDYEDYLYWEVGDSATFNMSNFPSAGSAYWDFYIDNGDFYIDTFDSSGYGGTITINDGASANINLYTVDSTGDRSFEFDRYGIDIQDPDYIGAAGSRNRYALNGTVAGSMSNGIIADNNATPDVTNESVFTYQGSSNSVVITDLITPVPGAIYRIIGNSDLHTISINHGGNFSLSGGNWTGGVDDSITLYCQADNDYIELGRNNVVGGVAYTFQDGLTEAGGTVKLGGANALTGATNIDMATFTLTLDGDADNALLTAHPTGGTPLAIATVDYVSNAAGPSGPSGAIQLSDGAGAFTSNGNLSYDGKTLDLRANAAQNIAIGFESGAALTTGSSRNTLMGYQAGKVITTAGNDNTCFGHLAGTAITTADENTIIGSSAGRSLTTQIRNVLIGQNAGEILESSNNVMIGQGSGLLTVGGGSNTFVGFNSGQQNTTGIANTFIGYFAGLQNTEGLNNVAMGGEALRYNQTGDENVVIGISAGVGVAANSFGGGVIIGYESAKGNTTGANNIFIGRQCALTNTTGSFNTYLGYQAGKTNTTGGNNTIIGYRAGEDGDHAITNFQNNVFIGYLSALNCTGEGNIIIGAQAGSNEVAISNKLIIDNSNTATPLIEGDFSTDELVINGTLEVTGGAKGIINVAKAQVLYTNTDQTTIITLPADAVIWNIGVNVTTIFDSDGTDFLTVGTTASSSRYLGLESIAELLFKANFSDAGEYLTNMPDNITASTNITFQYAYGGSAPTQGEAFVYVHYTLH